MMKWSGQYLKQKGIRSGRADAEHLLASVLGLKRMDLYLRFDQPLDARELAAFKRLLRRRAAREPLQYVLGLAPFRDLELAVDRRVAIPRPETEQLIDCLIDMAQSEIPFESALDIGTGSGAIAIALAAEGLAKSVVATDVSQDALDVARANAEACGQPGIDFRRGPGTLPVAGETFDLILSNPPYLSERQWLRTAPEIRNWEPHVAMVGGYSGYAVLKKITLNLLSFVRPKGWVGIEVGRGQDQNAFALMLIAMLGKGLPALRRDLNGTRRYVFAQREMELPEDDEADELDNAPETGCAATTERE